MKQGANRNVIDPLLDEFAVTVQERAKALAPVQSGRLQSNIKVYRRKSGTIVFSSVARNPLTGFDYAPIQHENKLLKHPNGGQAKYLEEPLREELDKLVLRIRRNITK
jgi:hypothetical protein